MVIKESTAHAQILVSGRVQGVWYRASAVRQANALGLAGWVRNLHDGRVELAAEGPRAVVDALVTWCWKGPPLAHVTAVDVTWGPTGGLRRPFELRSSAMG